MSPTRARAAVFRVLHARRAFDPERKTARPLGNDQPIPVVREPWTSSELMVRLQTRDFDARSGEVNYRLKNVKRAEAGRPCTPG